MKDNIDIFSFSKIVELNSFFKPLETKDELEKNRGATNKVVLKNNSSNLVNHRLFTIEFANQLLVHTNYLLKNI